MRRILEIANKVRVAWVGIVLGWMTATAFSFAFIPFPLSLGVALISLIIGFGIVVSLYAP